MDRPAPGSADELTQQNVETIARSERHAERVRTPAERAADAIAHGVGSWPFLIAQTAIFAFYIALNATAYVRHWDPYPFILLNLFLSFQAAYTGPILMMSQNRQARLSERRNHLDLQINLLAERETTEILRLLRCLCEKHGVAAAASDSALEERTQPETLLRQIEETVEKRQEKPKG